MEPVSPTGKALVALPAWLVSILAVVSSLCAAAALIPSLPPIVHQIAIALSGVCATLLGMSSGLRAPPPAVGTPEKAGEVLALPPK